MSTILEVVFTSVPDYPLVDMKDTIVINELDDGSLIRLVRVHKMPHSIRVLFREMQLRGNNLMEGDDKYVEARTLREALAKLTNKS
ncbi:MAG: hypothetical protein IH919_08220 [Deltaproteobacteria bacterium]|nr:hypothetical protein [Deltaproteobacteria bacterium]